VQREREMDAFVRWNTIIRLGYIICRVVMEWLSSTWSNSFVVAVMRAPVPRWSVAGLSLFALPACSIRHSIEKR